MSLFRRFQDRHNPIRGASSKDVKVAEVAIRAVCKVIEADEIGPTKVIADGKQAWVNHFLAHMRGYRLVDRGNAEILWVWFLALHQQRFPGMTPKDVLDRWHEASPITQADVDKAWKVDSASSREARERFYGPGGDPEQTLRELVDRTPVKLPAPADSPDMPDLPEAVDLSTLTH